MNEIWPTVTVSRDDEKFEAFPDLLAVGSRLLCAYLSTEEHNPQNRDWSKICVRVSDDAGMTWGAEHVVDEAANCLSAMNAPALGMREGRPVVLADQIATDPDLFAEGAQRTYGYALQTDLDTWDGVSPLEWFKVFSVAGMVPSAPVETASGFLFSNHYDIRKKRENIDHRVMMRNVSADTKSEGPRIPGKLLCEGTLCAFGDVGVGMLFRENSGYGFPAYKALTNADCDVFFNLSESSLQGCHRPRLGVLDEDRLLVTYRYYPGMNGVDRNTFGAVISRRGFYRWGGMAECPDIFPIHCDTAPVTPKTPDQGYTGWQIVGDELLVANYVINDAPKAYVVVHRIPMEFVNRLGRRL